MHACMQNIQFTNISSSFGKLKASGFGVAHSYNVSWFVLLCQLLTARLLMPPRVSEPVLEKRRKDAL